jgi:pimeloyl-ACP methyl ester carboxylesterase
MSRPRILLVPALTELEWTIRPLLEEWADVASYDAPGVGAEPPAEGSPFRARARRGLAELDRRGWDRVVVVGDELGSLGALLLARDRPEAVRALALGHPIVSFDLTSERRSLSGAVVDAHFQLAEASHRAFVLEQFRTWVGIRRRPAPDAEADRLAERFLARVPHAVATSFYGDVRENAETYAAELQTARKDLPRLPTLLVRHEGCLMFTPEGFEEAAAAMPDAETAATYSKPSVDPAFDDALREFVGRLPG